MGQGAVVLLISDGLDRDSDTDLSKTMERLSLTAKQVIWLNPLLRYDGFAPKARGIAQMLPHVDTFRAGHNIASLEGVAQALSQPEDGGDKHKFMALIDNSSLETVRPDTKKLGWSLAQRLAHLNGTPL
jgi:hypothetical protein